MYIPKPFEITDTAWCHALMRAQSFAAMITADDAGVPFATHLPILVDPARGPLGTLRGHVARANPHWRYLAAGRPTLVIFAGAHAYVSPSWYATHPSVPTWNYVAGMQRAIVAFDIPIERLEGKAKLSQNRDAVDQARTREALAAADDPLARTVAALMAGAPPR